MRAKALEDLVKHLEYAPVECDGMARLVATVLTHHNVAYQGMAGSITPRGCDYTIPHFWVQVGDLVIDYRAQMWLGDGKDIPHGVVKLSDYAALYQGEPFQLDPLSATLYEIMKMPFPIEMRNGFRESEGPGS
ncbi:hypothetical protein RBE51_18725 [Pseudomonas taiwanensis]|uniref:hypothetical protein n=1 Tax=Pseudomonas taiwanensis TaxID=470150 RepID=UPI0028DFB38A|nr:hypothetical protein [Pseudomonas taiwanensis]MDT8924829.1 hypothetical protein [Pseudomonas taiwanensis]